MNSLTKLIIVNLLLWNSISYAAPKNQFYGAIDGGIFEARFNNSYIDQTDLISQNINDSSLQNGYTGGLALGYTYLITARYFINVELAGNLDGNSALYQSGAANTAFSDKIELANHTDLTFAPGIITQNDFSPYLKLGISHASVRDYVTSPAGYDPIFLQYNTNKNIFGVVAGLGVRYRMSDRVKLFAETNYHDYGSLNFSSFQNFSANYTHSTHIYTYSVVVGAMYDFNI